MTAHSESEAALLPRLVDFDAASATLAVSGRFSLAESINFGFGARRAETGADVMRLAFVLDGYAKSVGVAVTQPRADQVRLEIVPADGAAVDEQAVARQVARVLSLDVDASGWDKLGRSDELIGRLQAARPGLRPPLFYSAYEAAQWSVLSARRPAAAMMAVRDRLNAEYGAAVSLAGEVMPCFPEPATLLRIDSFPSIPDVKLDRMKAIARVALDGGLDTDTLRVAGEAAATDLLCALNGIGPFYSSLIIIRALGHTDVLAQGEPRLLATLGALLGLSGPATQADLTRLAAGWQPWRTWATVAIRSAGPVVLEAAKSDGGQPGAAKRAGDRARRAQGARS